MPAAIAFIMFGIGLNLKFKDFYRVILRPKAVLTGLFCQLLLLPLLAFALIYFWPIAPIYKVGIILIAAAPGGTASNLVTHMLKGRVALSVSLTSFNSFAILFTIPVVVSLALSIFMGTNTVIDIALEDTFKEILFTVVLPVVVGIGVNEFTPERFTNKIKPILRFLLPAVLLLVFTLALFFDGGEQPTAFLKNIDLFIPLLIFNVTTMLLGFYISKKMRVKHDGAYTIAVEMGLQNSALAIFIASSVINSSEMALVAVIYSSFTFFSTWLVGWILKHHYSYMYQGKIEQR
jgi:BASS family bile acid:Na+ symporter